MAAQARSADASSIGGCGRQGGRGEGGEAGRRTGKAEESVRAAGLRPGRSSPSGEGGMRSPSRDPGARPGGCAHRPSQCRRGPGARRVCGGASFLPLRRRIPGRRAAASLNKRKVAGRQVTRPVRNGCQTGSPHPRLGRRCDGRRAALSFAQILNRPQASEPRLRAKTLCTFTRE